MLSLFGTLLCCINVHCVQMSRNYSLFLVINCNRKLLLSDLNEMRFREKDSSKSKVEEDDDPVLLKLFLKYSRFADIAIIVYACLLGAS